MNSKAEMGVGTLIIFIALLLVAAVAAGVLIQTSGSLQQRALSTGSDATAQISTQAVVLEVSALDGSNGAVDNFSVIMKLAPGSDSLNLDDATMSLSSQNSTQTFSYTNGSESTSTFSVSYWQQGSNNQVGRLVPGDVVEVRIIGEREFNEEESLRLSFVPKVGTPTRIEFAVPDVVTTNRVYVYP